MNRTLKKRGSPKSGAIVLAFLFGAFLTLTGQSARAQTRLTLTEAVQQALVNNHELKAQRNAHAARQAEVGIARSHLLPKVSLEERFLRTVNPTYAFMTKLNQERIELPDFSPDSLNRPAAISDFQTTLSVEQPLFVRKATIGVEMSQREADASQEALHRKREEIAFKVVQSYLTVRTAAEYVSVTERGLADAREHQRLADLRYAEGVGLHSDTLRAATAVAEARQRVVSAGKNHRLAKRTLGLLIGSARAIEVSDQAPLLPVREIDDLRRESLRRRDLKALELRRDNAVSNTRLADAGYFPSLGLGGTYQFNDHNAPLGREGDSWQVMAFLRWELFDGTKRNHEKAKAMHQVSEAEEYLAGMKKMVSFQVDEAWLSLEEAKVNRDVAREAVKTAEEGRRLVKVRYEGSLAPLVDLLDAQLSFDHARATLVARENEYTLALASLAYASGTILEDLQLEQPKEKAQ